MAMQQRHFLDSITREALSEAGAPAKTITTFLASTDGESRDGHIIDQDGWELANYRKNPVVQWCHDTHTPPIGKSVRIEVTSRGLEIDVEWDEKQALGALVARQYREGILRACSVGWDPIEMQPRQMLPKDHPHYADRYGYLFKRSELLELSAVPVGADPAALARSGLPGSAPGLEVVTRASLLAMLDDPEVRAAIVGLVTPPVPADNREPESDPDAFWRALADRSVE